MDFDKQYFLDKLKNGENVDDIADNIMDALNEAISDYEAYVKTKEEAARKAQEKKTLELECTRKILEECKKIWALNDKHYDLNFNDSELENFLTTFKLSSDIWLLNNEPDGKANIWDDFIKIFLN